MLYSPKPQQMQARRWKKRDSKVANLNDTTNEHLPLHVENDIDELGTFFSLMQPQDIARAHDFGRTLNEYAVDGVATARIGAE